MNDGPIFTSEDMILVPLEKSRISLFAKRVRAKAEWQDVVPGLADCAVRFDPLRLPFEDAMMAVEKALEAATVENAGTDNATLHRLTARIGGPQGPDATWVAERLGLTGEIALADWLAKRSYHVALIGFQPGFAYLDDSEGADLPEIGRLDSPRQRITAGSIGFLGGRACLYSQNGPGGWPIIGRIEAKLFDPTASCPALLSAGDIVTFDPL